MMIRAKSWEVSTPDGLMGAVVKRPDGDEPRPVVLLFHDGPGIREATRSSAWLARRGFYAITFDRYHPLRPVRPRLARRPRSRRPRFRS